MRMAEERRKDEMTRMPQHFYLFTHISFRFPIYIHPPTLSRRPQAPARSTRTILREGFNFMEMGSRFLNELLPWGDSSKGMWAGKRDAMVVKYMEKTGKRRDGSG